MLFRIVCMLNALKYWVKSGLKIYTLSIHPTAIIGRDVSIRRSTVISPLCEIGNHSELYWKIVLGPKVKIGDWTAINHSCIIGSGSIGNFCSIGMQVIIGPGQHPINHITTSTLFAKSLGLRGGGMKDAPIIGNDVWIGSRCIIMPGVKVGNGAIIGANSVVTKDIPPYAIVGGCPAKIIKYRCEEKTIEYLERMDIWTNYEDNLDFIKTMLAHGDDFEKYMK